MLLDLIRRARSLAVPAAAALLAGSLAALGANTTIFTSIGDQIFYGPLGGTYVKNVPVSLFSLTFAATQNRLVLKPAGTLAFGYVQMAPSPVPDGREACLFSTAAITTLYLTAPSDQTIADAVTTLAANGKVCYLYSLSNLTWNRSQ